MKLSLTKHSLSLSIACVAWSANAFAEDLPDAAPAPLESQPPIGESSPAKADATPLETAAPSPEVREAPRPTPSAPPATLEAGRVLEHYAREEAFFRMGEAGVGLVSAGALFGAGFAAEGEDMTWSHALWVGSGVAVVGSLARLLVPSELEHLASDSQTLSDEQLREKWRELSERALVERRTGAVFGALIGATSLTFGALVMGDEIGDLADDHRKILGTALLAGGGIGVAESVVDWFVPSSTERGFALVDEAPRVQMTAAPAPGGFSVGVQGVF